MRRKLVTVALSTAAGLALLLGGTAGAATPPKVVGKVGPGFTITLTVGGKKVTRLKAGVKYRFVVTDRSSDHDFRPAGPRLSKVLTGEEFTGTRSTVLTLRKGTYRFYCAPHSEGMRGSFTVT